MPLRKHFSHFKVKSADTRLAMDIVVSLLRRVSGVSDEALDYAANCERRIIATEAERAVANRYHLSLAYCRTAIHVSQGVARMSISVEGNRQAVACFVRTALKSALVVWRSSAGEDRPAGAPLTSLVPTRYNYTPPPMSKAPKQPPARQRQSELWRDQPKYVYKPKPDTAIRVTLDD